MEWLGDFTVAILASTWHEWLHYLDGNIPGQIVGWLLSVTALFIGWAVAMPWGNRRSIQELKRRIEDLEVTHLTKTDLELLHAEITNLRRSRQSDVERFDTHLTQATKEICRVNNEFRETIRSLDGRLNMIAESLMNRRHSD